MTQQYDHQYILALGRINNEHLYARKHGPAVYVLTDQPPGSLGYTIPDQERPQQPIQRTIEDYLQNAPPRQDDHNRR